MRQQPGRAWGLAAPLKVLAHRVGLIALLAVATGLVVLGKVDAVIVERGRAMIIDMATPMLEVVAQPISSVKSVMLVVDGWVHMRDENLALHQENERLRVWQTTARRLAAENRAYREMLRVRPDPATRFVTARVIAEGGGPFVRTLVIDAGAQSGVAPGQVAITGAGVVGRVIAAGQHSARLLAITDLNSRLPAVIEGGRARAIVEGDNSAMPRLSYLAPGVKAQAGDRLVTSGSGGLFPPGLPIGAVEIVDGVPRIHPWVRFDKLDFVRIVAYDPTAAVAPIPDPVTPSLAPLPSTAPATEPAPAVAPVPPAAAGPAPATAPLSLDTADDAADETER